MGIRGPAENLIASGVDLRRGLVKDGVNGWWIVPCSGG